jgi:hypothetical protein
MTVRATKILFKMTRLRVLCASHHYEVQRSAVGISVRATNLDVEKQVL